MLIVNVNKRDNHRHLVYNPRAIIIVMPVDQLLNPFGYLTTLNTSVLLLMYVTSSLVTLASSPCFSLFIHIRFYDLLRPASDDTAKKPRELANPTIQRYGR